MQIQMRLVPVSVFASPEMFPIPSILHRVADSETAAGKLKIFALLKNRHLYNSAQPQLLAIFQRINFGDYDERWLEQASPRAYWRAEPDETKIGRIARRIAHRQVGLALSSGGARGLAHIGVLKVLREEKIRVVHAFLFLASGSICMSAMNASSFEALYSAFSRMQVQRTWDAILNAPITLDDVVLAELLWAASKSLLSGLAILLVVLALGLVQSPLQSPQLLWLLPVIPLIGLCFAALALMITALARSYDFFMYYFTLVITPMSMLSGVFFPVSQLPQTLQNLALLMPMYHATQLVRPLMLGQWPHQALLHVAVLLGCAVFGLYGASILFRRRLAR